MNEIKRDSGGRFAKGCTHRVGIAHTDHAKRAMSQNRKGKAVQEQHHHWKPEIHSGEQIECACGCGTMITKWDKKGRLRKYVMGHQLAGKPRPVVSERLRQMWADGTLKPRGGAEHWNWKGGVTPSIRLLRHTPEYHAWRHSVYARDLWTCQDCGKHCGRKDIVAHHIKSFKDYPELRHDVGNGITLCRKCHMKIEKEVINAS